jgi:putative ABC transport system substrate-binding protein
MFKSKQGWFGGKGSFAILLVAISLLLNACGPKSGKVYRVGIISGLDYFYDTAIGFKAGMTELGYVEGKNIVYDIQRTNFEPAKEEQILEKFIAEKADLIFSFPTEASLVAKKATAGTKIPVVFANANIEGVDLVKSVREPGGNITGVRYPGPDLAIRRFEITLELLPSAKIILLPYQRGYPNVTAQLAVLRPAAAAKGVELIEAPVAGAKGLQSYLGSHPDLKVDAVFFIAEPISANLDAIRAVAKYAEKRKLPICGPPLILEGYGPVFGLSTDNLKVGRQAAVLADRIFKGEGAGRIMVVSAENYLIVNYKSAKMIGLKVDEGLLRVADQVIR